MALFIAVRPHEQNLSPWNAMLVDRTLSGLQAKRRYSSTDSRDIPRSNADRRIGTQSYLNNDTGNQTTLVLFELPGAVSQREGFR